MTQPTVTTVPISVVRRDARESGSHFFDPETMRFFRSRLHLNAQRIEYGDVVAFVFVTSEQFVSPSSGAEPRRYTVRVRRAGDPTGCSNVLPEDVGQFQRYARLADAVDALHTEAVPFLMEAIPNGVDV